MEVKKQLTSLHTPDKEKTYKLSALIDVDSFFYALLDAHDQVAEIKHVNLESHLTKDEYPNIISAKVAVANEFYTLIPEVEYEKDMLADYVQNVIGVLPKNEYVFQADYVSSAGLYVCYAISKRLYRYCHGLPCIPIILHHISTLLSQIKRATPHTVIHISRSRNNIVVFVLHEGQCRLANTFESKSPLTTLYYITLIQEQLGLKKQEIDIELSGTLIPEDETDRLITKYFPNIRYSPSSLKMNGQFLENSSIYFPLQSVALCV